MRAPFFFKVHEIDGDQEKIILYPWRSPPGHTPPNMTKNTRFNRILGHLGDIFKKGRTPGEKCQNLHTELNNVPPNFGAPSMTSLEETRVSKLKKYFSHI